MLARNPKPQKFVRGVHFFGSASPLNFWDTFRRSEIDEYLQRFLDDGFDTVLLLVPWAQFQPTTNPIAYCEFSFERLHAIFKAAHSKSMSVVLRLGYLWEARPALDQTYRRFNEYHFREDLRQAWKAYLHRIYQLASEEPNFRFAFISWEDFYWPIFAAGSAGVTLQRAKHARLTGFRDFLRRRFTLAGINTIYNLQLASWNEVAIPTKSDFLYEQYMRFYENEILDPICCAAVESFPGIMMEMRVDPEWISTPNGRKFYHWNMNFPGALRKIIYYHANIARSSDHEHTSHEALLHLRDLLSHYCRMSPLGEEKPFIDQFNFFDDTFVNWTKISEQAVPEFIEKCLDVLKHYSSGYAIWGYQDWPKDVIYNGTFELGREGWDLIDGAQVASVFSSPLSSDKHLVLSKGQEIRQSGFVLKLPANEPRVVAVTGRPKEGSQSKLGIRLNDSSAEVELCGEAENEYTVSFAEKDLVTLSITALDGSTSISQIRLFDRYYSQGFRTSNGGIRPAVEAFRIVNEKLASAYADG